MKKAIITFIAVISYKFKQDLENIIKRVEPTINEVISGNKTVAKVEKFKVEKIIKEE